MRRVSGVLVRAILLALVLLAVGSVGVAMAESEPSLTIESTQGSETSNPRPSFRGEANGTGNPVTLEIKATKGGFATTLPAHLESGGGEWSLTVSSDLEDGTYTAVVSEENERGETEKSSVTFTVRAAPEAPTVMSKAASSIAQTTATLNATVNPNGGEVSKCEFEYGETTSYGKTASCASLPGSGTSAVAVSASLTGLTANTSYHFRISATNAGGTSKGSDQEFKTLPNAESEPSLTIEITQGSETSNPRLSFRGEANGSGNPVTLEIKATKGGFATTLSAHLESGGGEWSLTVSSDLEDGTYTATASEENEKGETERSAVTFTVSAPIAVVTNPVSTSVVAGETATFTAAASAYPAATLQWEISTDSGSTWTQVPGATGETMTVAGTTLAESGNEYRAVFSNKIRTVISLAATLTVVPEAPTVVTKAASPIAQTTATLNATVNPNGGEVSKCEFEYGETTSYGKTAPCASLPGSGESAVAVSAEVTGLTANTTYHFRMSATNTLSGISYGLDQTFTSLPITTLPSPGGVTDSQEHSAPPVPNAMLASAALTASSSGTVSVTVTCPTGESSCSGTITLRTLSAVIAGTGHQSKRSKATILTLASGSFKVAGGHTTTVRLNLSAKVLALLARTHVLRARATIVAHDPAGATHTTQTVLTILAARAKRKG